MTDLLRTRATAVWALLVAATLALWWLGSGEGDGRAASAAILAIAFLKVHLVGRHFMELRTAPVRLRRALDLYVLATGATLITWVLLSR